MTRAVISVVVASVVAITFASTPAGADHPGAFRIEGMSPLATALITGGLALLVALIVVALILVFTRPGADRPESDSQ